MENYKILLVDDDPLILKAIGLDLKKKGYHVTSVDSGEKAIELLNNETFDLVLTDMVMEPIDGIEVLKKAKDINPDLMVIILTGYADMASAVETFRVGADDYLAKPCEPAEIHFRLERCFEKLEDKRGVKQAEEDLQRSEQNMKIRNQINDIFLRYPDEYMYSEILDLVLKVLESEYGTFGYFAEDGAFVAPAVTRKIYWEKCNVPDKNIIFQKGTFSGIWGEAIKEKRTLISNEGPFHTPQGHIPIINTMATPIIFHKNVISAFHIANKSGGYSEKDKAILEMIAEQISPVLYARLQRDKEEREKQNLQSQLLQTHKMESIGTLAGGIAHEFNNILGIIVGNTELAMGGIPEWNTAHYNLEEIKKSSLRAREIVKQILAFSRQTKHELKPINFSSIIDESIKFIRSSIPTTIEIKKYISARRDTINADPTQINQILLNLCNNAAYEMQDKGGVLEISLENVDLDENAVKSYDGLSPGNHVKLTVSDTGHGIEKENLEQIFDPFFTTKEVGKGTGMGLSVVHGIVKEHNGSITVQSEAGKGTAFHVLFPVIEDKVKSEIESEEAPAKGSERILFVDDEESLVLAAKKNLEDLGYDVITKRNPVEALELFKEHPDEFDLVITDMTMPEMTGDRFAKEIMKINPNTTIVVCTGHSDRMNEEQAKEMGINAYIMKPYLASEIATAIRQVFDNEKGPVPVTPKRILIVDDEAQIRTMLRKILEDAGYEVSEAPDGKVALWIHKEKPADLIITDLIMPEKEGIETILELKKDFPDVKMIAISGGGKGDLATYLDLARKSGADSALGKPFEKEELLKEVKDLLG